MENLNQKNIGIFYRHHKYQSINGSLFYALEYYFTLSKLLKKEQTDSLILNKDHTEKEIKFYWIFPKKLINSVENKNKFKARLLKLLAAKYPITYRWTKKRDIFSIRTGTERLSSIDKILRPLEEKDKEAFLKSNFNENIKFLDTLTKKIEIISESDLIKIKTDKSLFISQNTVHDCILKDLVTTTNNFGKKYFILNRCFNDISSSHKRDWQKIIANQNDVFLYELDQQKIVPTSNNQIQYSLKLGTEWFWPKDILNVYKKCYGIKEKVQTGEPDYTNLLSRPLNFDFLDTSYENFRPYMVWKEILYNKREFEENNRAIIEAYFYDIPFTIINEYNDKTNKTDSIYTRNISPESYYLNDNDFLLKELLDF